MIKQNIRFIKNKNLLTCISARWLVCRPDRRSATFLQKSTHKCDKRVINTHKQPPFEAKQCWVSLTVGGWGPSTPRYPPGRLLFRWTCSSHQCTPPRRRLHTDNVWVHFQYQHVTGRSSSYPCTWIRLCLLKENLLNVWPSWLVPLHHRHLSDPSSYRGGCIPEPLGLF